MNKADEKKYLAMMKWLENSYLRWSTYDSESGEETSKCEYRAKPKVSYDWKGN